MKTKKRSYILTFTGIVAGISVMAGCASAQPHTDTDKSEGALKNVSLDVVNSRGETSTYSESTKAETLKEYMDELKENTEFTYEGSDSQYGIFIESVNGESANYDTDKAYWSIYVNGEYGQNGADTQTITDGDAFRLVYEKAN